MISTVSRSIILLTSCLRSYKEQLTILSLDIKHIIIDYIKRLLLQPMILYYQMELHHLLTEYQSLATVDIEFFIIYYTQYLRMIKQNKNINRDIIAYIINKLSIINNSIIINDLSQYEIKYLLDEYTHL